MERYNIPNRRTPQVRPPAEAPTNLATPARWPGIVSKSRPSPVAAGMAMLLHVAVGMVVLIGVRLPVAPAVSDETSVALVFAPPQPVSPEPLAPAATPEPPPPAETSAPPEAPAAQPPPPPKAETKSPATEPSITRPPVRKPAPRVKPVTPPRVAQTPPAIKSQPSEPPLSQTAPRSLAAEAPIAGDWQRSLATWLAAHKTYPDEALRRGIEGNVALRLTVDRSGRVLDVVLLRSAGASMLDAAAEAMVRNAVLPPFTAGMSQDTVTITIQLHYALTN